LRGDIIFNLQAILMSIPGAIIAITLHEWVKAMTAHKLGDGTFKAQGRTKPNPLKHMDPLGTIFMLIFGYGWANPVRINMFRMRGGKKEAVIIFLMPFLANIIMGAFLAFAAMVLRTQFFHLFAYNFDLLITLNTILRQAAMLSISFAFFNILPVYPLDGINLVAAFKPMWAARLVQREKIFQIILALAIIMGFAAMAFNPIARAILGVF